MLVHPLARAQEFERLLHQADLQPGMHICDCPAGGGYLGRFVPVPVTLTAIETSSVFVQQVVNAPPQRALLCPDLGKIPLPTASQNRVLSLAGVHHVGDRLALYREWARLLKPGGWVCLADVWQGTAVADFLNGFVHAHNSLGHEGLFLTDRDRLWLAQAGLHITQAELQTYPWTFPTVDDMVQFCRLLFGLDQATDQQIEAGIANHLGYRLTADGCLLNWALYFITAVKLADNPLSALP